MNGLDDYFVSSRPSADARMLGPAPTLQTAAAPSAMPSPRGGRGSSRLIAAGVAALLLAGVTGWQLRPEPKDTRPIAVPDMLGGQPRTTDPRAAGQAADVQRDAATKWWPGHQVAVGFYDGDLPSGSRLFADPSTRGIAGSHLIVLRGRFGSKSGDTRFFTHIGVQPSSAQFGATTCQWQRSVAVCWRETDRLSVSVLHLLSAEPEQVAAEVEEAWSAAA